MTILARSDNYAHVGPGGKLFPLEYADDIHPSKDPGKLEVFPENFTHGVSMFGMRTTPSKCAKYCFRIELPSSRTLLLQG